MSIGKLEHLAITGPKSMAISWDDGRTANVDFVPVIARRKVLGPLNDALEFANASLSADGWSIEWPCGIDLGAPQLRRWADEQAGAIMPANEFRAWMDSNALTLDRAAEALGLSRRTIAYYLSGEQPVPKTVMLATEGFTHRRAA
jgi:Protein of unknown function (DUF2442)